jgi:hypothetical protein
VKSRVTSFAEDSDIGVVKERLQLVEDVHVPRIVDSTLELLDCRTGAMHG